LPEKRLDAGLQLFIALAGFGQMRGALLRRVLQSSVIKIFDPQPSLRRHKPPHRPEWKPE
jgi:hypothetical protein